MRAIPLLAAGLVLLLPSALRAESFRVERSPEGSVRVLARVLSDPPSAGAAAPRPAWGAGEAARAFVRERSALLGLAGVALLDTRARVSPGAYHVIIPTAVSDPASPADRLPIFGGEIAVHMAADGRVLLVTNDPRGHLLEPEGVGGGPVATPDAAIERAMAAAGSRGPFRGVPRAALVAARTASGFRRAWQVELPPVEPVADWLFVVDEQDGAILFRVNRLLNDRPSAAVDTTGRGMVFDPHPIAASGDPRLEDWSEVDQYRVERALPGLDGSGYLRGPYVDAVHSRPTATRAQRFDFQYDYLRSEPFFAEATVYYHLDRYQRRLQSYGFADANNRQIRADVHSIAEDNSYYEFFSRTLLFGDGGVDDAEDEEIVLHEYGHAIHHNIVPGLATSGTNSQARALSEGWSDYIAASYGGDPCIGEWDATAYSDSLPPCLRRTDQLLVYPLDWRGQIHDDGEIWASALWAVRQSLGRTVTDRLAIQSYYFTSGTSTMPDAGWALVLSDWTLYGGAHRATIEAILSERGLLPAGQDLLLADDSAVKIGLGFPFTFVSAIYDSVYVGSNGNLTFLSADASPAGDAASLAAGPPRVALFWSDLDPSAGTVRVERWSGGVTVSYDSVSVAGETVPLSASVTLFKSTNEIQMTYAGAPAASVLIGIAAGGGFPPSAADFETLPIDAAPAGGLYQVFPAGPGADFALAGQSLRFTRIADGTYRVHDPELQTAVAVTHFEAVPEPGAILLRWGLPPGHSVVGYRVERAAGENAGSFLGGLTDARDGENEFLDPSVTSGTEYRYWVHLVERDGGTTIIGPVSAVPKAPVPRLLAPNPFHPGASFRILGAGSGEATLSIFDVRGRRVRELRETRGPSGTIEIVWRGEDEGGRALSSGIYFVRLRGESTMLRQRLLLLR